MGTRVEAAKSHRGLSKQDKLKLTQDSALGIVFYWHGQVYQDRYFDMYLSIQTKPLFI